MAAVNLSQGITAFISSKNLSHLNCFCWARVKKLVCLMVIPPCTVYYISLFGFFRMHCIIKYLINQAICLPTNKWILSVSFKSLIFIMNFVAGRYAVKDLVMMMGLQVGNSFYILDQIIF